MGYDTEHLIDIEKSNIVKYCKYCHREMYNCDCKPKIKDFDYDKVMKRVDKSPYQITKEVLEEYKGIYSWADLKLFEGLGRWLEDKIK